MPDSNRRCSHCKGSGRCRACHGSGRLALQKGKTCTSCYPHGSGKCANCRGTGWLDETGKPVQKENDELGPVNE